MLLEIKDLYVSYGHIDALNGISLNVEKGQIISIIGSNGAGKTTLLSTISGIVKRKSGRICFEGEELPSEPHKIVRRGITQVPEGRKVFAGLTIEENLIMGGMTQKVRDTKEIEKRMFELFPRLDERRKQQAGTMSGGEQQMLAIARGLMSQPKLLLLDEPSLGLAPIVVKQVFALIKDIRDMGYTVLLVEQNANQALKLSDYAYVLENGTIKMEGKSSDLLQNNDIISAYLGEKK
ncbi:ABC transporter ATP-binding protein [Oscillospiraceae bacterium PP1C4]